MLKNTGARQTIDGINTLTYNLTSIVKMPLYTRINAAIDQTHVMNAEPRDSLPPFITGLSNETEKADDPTWYSLTFWLIGADIHIRFPFSEDSTRPYKFTCCETWRIDSTHNHGSSNSQCDFYSFAILFLCSQSVSPVNVVILCFASLFRCSMNIVTLTGVWSRPLQAHVR